MTPTAAWRASTRLAVPVTPGADSATAVERLREHAWLGLSIGPSYAAFAAAVERLKEHAWPGNVRKLSHLIEELLLVSPSDEILPEHLPFGAAVPEGGAEIRLGRYRRLSKDCETLTHSSETMIPIAMINLVIHRRGPGQHAFSNTF
ncbi:MAG: hypothetical protein IT449_13265 [Phycisphaerales bacterium]|nr:hypothetical protein [Phycisphaerales bacterium]